MKIFLTRHAEGDRVSLNWQTPETVLSERGIKQAKNLADRLSRFNVIDLIVSSDWVRSRQTAEIVGKVLKKPVKVLKNIHEREQSTKIYGLSRNAPLAKKYWTDLTKNQNDWGYKWDKEEESLAELIKRTIDFKKLLVKKYLQKSVLVVSHESFLRGLVTTGALGDNFEDDHFKNLFNYSAMENTGLSLLIYKEAQKRWKLWYLNDHSHL